MIILRIRADHIPVKGSLGRAGEAACSDLAVKVISGSRTRKVGGSILTPEPIRVLGVAPEIAWPVDPIPADPRVAAALATGIAGELRRLIVVVLALELTTDLPIAAPEEMSGITGERIVLSAVELIVAHEIYRGRWTYEILGSHGATTIKNPSPTGEYDESLTLVPLIAVKSRQPNAGDLWLPTINVEAGGRRRT